jgi:hypothetical protein
MKKILLLLMVLGLFLPAFSFFPFFYGARSLSLGYSSLAFNYDLNAAYINPALLYYLSASLGGYQYESSFLDFRDAGGRLGSISPSELRNFQDLDATRKEALLAELGGIFAAKAPLSGFQMHNPGYAGKGYAIAIARVDAAIAYPLPSDVLARPAGEVTNEDIASLRLRFIGLHYDDYSLSFAVPLSQGIAAGATVHYLKGRNAEFDASITAEPFASGTDAADLLKYAWSAAEKSFSRLNFDLGLIVQFGAYFKAGLAVKNLASPLIATDMGELKLERRMIAGLAFRPDGQFGIYLDIDVARSDLYHSGEEAQPLSLGLEKGLFRNKLFLRAGLLSDLAAKYLVGRKSNAVYGLGLGFNLGKFLVDLSLGLDPAGRAKNLAISGFYVSQ